MQTACITQLLADHRAGDDAALSLAFDFIYDDLRRAAHAQLRRGAAATLNTTSLVNEAYLRLSDRSVAIPADRAHFLALAARAMRFIIIDYARERTAAKRGGVATHIQFDDAQVEIEEQAHQLIALNDAIEALSQLDGRLVEIVECRFFCGMTEEETADALAVSVSTVQRDWRRAKAWLKEEMRHAVT